MMIFNYKDNVVPFNGGYIIKEDIHLPPVTFSYWYFAEKYGCKDNQIGMSYFKASESDEEDFSLCIEPQINLILYP